MGLKLGSEKYNNYDYAPGISTYGIDGKEGETGKNGTSLFVCLYDVTTSSGLINFQKSIIQNLIMTQNSTDKIDRDYISGDSFLFPNGYIYKIINISNLRDISMLYLLSILNFNSYMELVGSIDLSDNTDKNIFSSSSGRLIINTNAYKGFSIDNTHSETITLDNNSPFVIVSDEVDNANNIYFMKLKSIFSNSKESDFDIYFNGNNNAYHIESVNPIVFDANVLIVNNTDDDYDEYSKILTSDNSITKFHGICNNISYSISFNSNIMTLSINNNNEQIFDELKTSNIHIVCIKDNEICKEIYCTKDISNIDNTTDINITLDKIRNYSTSNYTWKISIINSIEVFINKSN